MSMKVLIVDSDGRFVGQARDILESCGHYVVHEPRPEQALARARKWRPDVTLISAELPAASEGDLLRRFGDVRPRPAVLLVASLDRFDKAWQAWQRGGDEVLFKPMLQPSELHVSILVARENALLPRRPGVMAHPVAKSA